jgi:hypothetical protein
MCLINSLLGTSDSASYRRLSHSAQFAAQSILLSPPTSILAGLWRSIRIRDVFTANVALSALLAKFTPLLLSNVPFRKTVTWKMHEACTWLAVAILAYMILVLLGTFWTRQFYMPVQASSIAGCLYYICDSSIIDSCQGLSLHRTTERDRLVSNLAHTYRFGKMIGVSGTTRIGVESIVERDTKTSV